MGVYRQTLSTFHIIARLFTHFIAPSVFDFAVSLYNIVSLLLWTLVVYSTLSRSHSAVVVVMIRSEKVAPDILAPVCSFDISAAIAQTIYHGKRLAILSLSVISVYLHMAIFLMKPSPYYLLFRLIRLGWTSIDSRLVRLGLSTFYSQILHFIPRFLNLWILVSDTVG